MLIASEMEFGEMEFGEMDDSVKWVRRNLRPFSEISLRRNIPFGEMAL